MKNLRKKSIAVLAGLAFAGLIGASAASLGDINSDNLGADAAGVASCDLDGVTVAYNTSVVAGVPVVDSVRMSDVDAACGGQRIEIILTDDSDTQLGVGSRNVPAGGGSFNVTLDAPADAETTTGIAIVIAGTPVGP